MPTAQNPLGPALTHAIAKTEAAHSYRLLFPVQRKPSSSKGSLPSMKIVRTGFLQAELQNSSLSFEALPRETTFTVKRCSLTRPEPRTTSDPDNYPQNGRAGTHLRLVAALQQQQSRHSTMTMTMTETIRCSAKCPGDIFAQTPQRAGRMETAAESIL